MEEGTRMHRATLLLFASAVVIGLAAAAAAADRTENVKLSVGGHSVSRSDSITGRDTLSYKLKGAKGEKLNINFVSTRGSCKFDLYSPGIAVPMFLGVAPASAFSGSLSENGDYRVKVKMDPASGKTCGFNITFKLRH
jgi:hypothetical protein